MRARIILSLVIAVTAAVACSPKQQAPVSRSVDSQDAPARDGRRIALVIGNNRYTSGSLVNPANDAELIGTTLKSLGFDVALRKNGSQAEMKRAIQEFGAKLEAAGQSAVGLFFYAGHGLQIDGHNYLIPVDARIERDSDAEIEAVSADWVLDQMRYARNHLNFIILDACRNNPYARSVRSAIPGLARMEAPEGVLISYSTAPGAVAEDGTGANSPYTEALARAMRDSHIPAELMFKQARNEVVRVTNRHQVPWDASSLTGQDFYFAASEATPPALTHANGSAAPGSGPPEPDSPTIVAATNGPAANSIRELSHKLPPAPALGAASGRCDSIPGEWKVENPSLTGTAVFKADHTVTALGARNTSAHQGTWTCDSSNLGVVIRYQDNMVHELDMDVSVRNMVGRDHDGNSVIYRR